MISEMAMGDISDMEAEGLSLCPSDIIKLNELGLRVERSANSGNIMSAPRIGWAQDIPIYEPTLQSEAWIDTYPMRWFAQDAETYTSCLLFACAHAQTRGFFQRPEMLDRASVVNAIQDWHKCLPVTSEQLRTALQFALWGNDSGSDIYPEPSERQTEKEVTETATADLRQLIIDELIASGLGLSLSDMQLISESRLFGILRKYQRNQGVVSKEANLKAHAEYARTLLVIKTKALEAKIQVQ